MAKCVFSDLHQAPKVFPNPLVRAGLFNEGKHQRKPLQYNQCFREVSWEPCFCRTQEFSLFPEPRKPKKHPTQVLHQQNCSVPHLDPSQSIRTLPLTNSLWPSFRTKSLHPTGYTAAHFRQHTALFLLLLKLLHN